MYVAATKCEKLRRMPFGKDGRELQEISKSNSTKATTKLPFLFGTTRKLYIFTAYRRYIGISIGQIRN